MGTLTKNFDWSELIKNDNLNVVPSQIKDKIKLLTSTILQPAREILGLPIHITSGYRSPEHNAKVGGASNSQHLYGTASDIYVDSLTGLQLFEFFVKNFGNKLGGIGLYSSESERGKFIHIDIRTRLNNSITAWYQNINSQYVSPNQAMVNIFNQYKIKFEG